MSRKKVNVVKLYALFYLAAATETTGTLVLVYFDCYEYEIKLTFLVCPIYVQTWIASVMSLLILVLMEKESTDGTIRWHYLCSVLSDVKVAVAQWNYCNEMEVIVQIRKTNKFLIAEWTAGVVQLWSYLRDFPRWWRRRVSRASPFN